MRTLAYRLIAVALIGAALSLTTESFLTVANVLNVFRQASLTFLIASGLTLTILTAGLDLSVGANVGLSACLAATVMQSTGSVLLGAATGLVFGAGVGVVNGLMVTLLRLPPFIATYGMLWTLNGVTYWFMGGDTIHGFSPGFRALGSGYWLGVPIPIYLMLGFLLAGAVFTRYTTLGHDVYAIGANREAARLSGVPVRSRINLVYVLSGAMAGLAAVVYLARLNSAEADIGEPLTLAGDCRRSHRRDVALWRRRQPARHAGWRADADAGRQRHEPAGHRRELAAPCHRRDRAAGGVD